MDIYALYGHSGTGKSHQAPVLAKQYEIDYIIDDGLLIKGNVIVAGRSAKREQTRFGAIKRALFQDPEHAAQVKEKLVEVKPRKVMLIGTSQRMTEVIAENLELPLPTHYLRIEEVVDSESIRKALNVRARENRHVIPLPTFAIKKEFPGYVIDPLRSFFRVPSAKPEGMPVERSVIRPVYSTLGSFFINEHVIIAMVEYVATSVPGVHKATHVDLENGRNKVYLHLDLVVDLLKVPELRIDLLLEEVHRRVKDDIEYQTGLYIDKLNIHAQRLRLGKSEPEVREALKKLMLPPPKE